MGVLDNFLGRFGLSWSGNYEEYYAEEPEPRDSPAAYVDPKGVQSAPPSKIAILVNSRCEKDVLSKNDWLKMSQVIEEEMTWLIFSHIKFVTARILARTRRGQRTT